MVRMLAFMPLATPVCSAGTDAMTTPARLENTRPEPTPWTVVAAYSCQVVVVEERDARNETPATHQAGADDDPGPDPRDQPGGGEADDEAGRRRGEQQVARLGDGRAEAVAGLGRCLQQLGDEPERREGREAHRAGDHVGGPHATPAHQLHVDHRHRAPAARCGSRPSRPRPASANSPSTRAESQPCSLPQLRPSSRATRKSASSTAGRPAAARASGPGSRARPGTRRPPRRSVAHIGSRNSQW